MLLLLVLALALVLALVLLLPQQVLLRPCLITRKLPFPRCCLSRPASG
jgi:hypothetical protein